MSLQSYREVINEHSSALNEQDVVNFFCSYLGEMSVNEAITAILNDPIIQNSSEGESEYLFSGVLLATVIQDFAERFSALDEENHFEENLNASWETFCRSEDIPLELQNFLAKKINESAGAFFTESENEDDEDFVLSVDDWKNLTDEQRAEKLKAFLRALANVHNDARDNKPFIKHLDKSPDTYGNDYLGGVKPFSRQANRYGHDNDNYTDDNRAALKQSNVPTIPVERTALPNRPIVEQLAVVDRGNVARYCRYMNKTLKRSSAAGYNNPAHALQDAGRLRDENEKKMLQTKNDRDRDWTLLSESQLLNKKRKNN